jgi:hypothetical protein
MALDLGSNAFMLALTLWGWRLMGREEALEDSVVA